MNYKHIALSFTIFLLGQVVVWIQTNGPLIWDWAKTYKAALMLLGVPMGIHGSDPIRSFRFWWLILARKIYLICSRYFHIHNHDTNF